MNTTSTFNVRVVGFMYGIFEDNVPLATCDALRNCAQVIWSSCIKHSYALRAHCIPAYASCANCKSVLFMSYLLCLTIEAGLSRRGPRTFSKEFRKKCMLIHVRKLCTHNNLGPLKKRDILYFTQRSVGL